MMTSGERQTISFDQAAPQYDQARRALPNGVLDHLAGLIGSSDSSSRRVVVDVGSGTGQLLRSIAEHRQNRRWTGISIDRSSAMLSTLGSRRWPSVAGVAEALPLKIASVDVVTCCQALHLFDRPSFLAEVRQVLRETGLIVVVTYDMVATTGSLARITNEAIREVLNAPDWPAFDSSGIHPSVVVDLQDAGFAQVRTWSRGSVSSFSIDEWVRRIESSSLILQLGDDRIRQSVLDIVRTAIRHRTSESRLPQLHRCWVVAAEVAN